MYSAIHSRFRIQTSCSLELTSRKHAFSGIFCNGEFELIRARHAFSHVYRHSVNRCSSNSIQWISPPGFNYTEGSKSILSHFPLPDRISTPLIILNKFIDDSDVSGTIYSESRMEPVNNLVFQPLSLALLLYVTHFFLS